MTISTASVGEELAMLKRAVVALEAKLPLRRPRIRVGAAMPHSRSCSSRMI